MHMIFLRAVVCLQVGLHYTESYSATSNQWVEKAMISDQRFAFGAAYVNEGVLAAGGHIFCNDTLSEDCGNRSSPLPFSFFDANTVSTGSIMMHFHKAGIVCHSTMLCRSLV